MVMSMLLLMMMPRFAIPTDAVKPDSRTASPRSLRLLRQPARPQDENLTAHLEKTGLG